MGSRSVRNYVALEWLAVEKDLTDAHSAEADTLATYEVLEAQIERYGDIGSTVEELAEFSSNGPIVDFAGRLSRNDKGEIIFTFGKYKGCTVVEVFTKDPSYYSWIMKGDFSRYTKKKVSEIRLSMK